MSEYKTPYVERGGRVESFAATLWGKAIVLALYFSLNILLNMSNKWVLSHYGFAFPLLLSLSHMAFSFTTLSPIMGLAPFKDLHIETLKKQGLGLVFVGIFFAVNVGLNNMSLLWISLSLNQVIRASIPVVTAVASFYIEHTRPSKEEFISLLMLFIGVALAVFEGSNTKASFIGVIMCIAGTICNGLMMSCSGRLMSEKIDVLRLTWYTAPISCILLFPFFSTLEAPAFQQYRQFADASYIGLVLLTCFVALAYNMIHYLMIQITSSVTTTVIGEMKIVAILCLSALYLGESEIWSFRMMIGCMTAIVGFCMYSHIKLNPKATLPLIKGVPELPPPFLIDGKFRPSSDHFTEQPMHLDRRAYY